MSEPHGESGIGDSVSYTLTGPDGEVLAEHGREIESDGADAPGEGDEE